jgi:hypothetical protein
MLINARLAFVCIWVAKVGREELLKIESLITSFMAA